MGDCVFCMIASGTIPSSIFYETDDLVAFDDLNPQAPIHSLIVPKKHYASLEEGVPSRLLGALLDAVPQVAALKGISESGYRVIINTGADAGQTVPHLHVHVLGGVKMQEGMLPDASVAL